jgi:prepilin-type N-terminal cleavage/methylation domain-containing protein
MKSPGNNAGFTLVEAMMSILIVGVMFVAALQTLGSSRLSQATIANQRRGYELAQQLLAEMIALPYKEPAGGTTNGPDTGEVNGKRSLFDDIDDYHAWTEQPPALKDGTALTNLADWSRRVTVTWVDPASIDTTRGTESGMKRITVSVSRGLKPVASLTALRANVE